MAEVASRSGTGPDHSIRVIRGDRGNMTTKSSSRNALTEPKEFIVVIFNLPFLLDPDNYQRFANANWKPIKDLLRRVINKKDDGTDFTTQTATPTHVKVMPEAQGRGGYAVCTFKQEAHAKRVLRWLGGNIWYGWTLSIIVCCKIQDEHRLVDRRWHTAFSRPLDLNSLSNVSDNSMLRLPPQAPLSPPYTGQLGPETRVCIPSWMLSAQTSTIPSVPYHSLSASPNASNANGMTSFSHPQQARNHQYGNIPETASVNIMIHIGDQGWRPYGSNLLSQPLALPYTPISSSISQSTGSTLSPTAASFPSVPAPVTPMYSVAYHTNPNGALINTTHGTIPIRSPLSVLIRNLNHQTSRATVETLFQSAGCFVTRYETKEHPNPSGLTKKKVTAIVGFATPDEAIRVKAVFDGKELEERKISIEVMKDENTRDCQVRSGHAHAVNKSLRGSRERDCAKSDSETNNADSSDGKRLSQSSGPVIANGSEDDELSEGGSLGSR